MELSMPADPSAQCPVISLLLSYCGTAADQVQVQRDQPKLSAKVGADTLTGINTICKAIAQLAAPSLLGSSPDAVAQVDQFMAMAATELTPVMDAKLVDINAWLAPRTFITGHALSLADFVLYTHLSDAITHFPKAQRSVFCHLMRWYAHVHHVADAGSAFPGLSLPCAVPPTLAPPAATPSSSQQSAQTAKPKGAAADAKPAASAASGESAKGKDAGKGKGGKGGGESAKGGDDAAAPSGNKGAAAGDGDAAAAAAAKKAERAAKNAAKQAPAASAASAPSIDQLDIRVGTITACEAHPNAESLYLEQIDCGEDKPRTVISGLVKFVPLDAMVGRRVAVVLNLKPAKMRDIVSHGMVLCASNDAHDAVDPVAIPEGVPNGERIVCEGYPADADTQINPKKKILETLKPDMRTNAEGVACFKGVPFMTSKGPITASIKEASVQ